MKLSHLALKLYIIFIPLYCLFVHGGFMGLNQLNIVPSDLIFLPLYLVFLMEILNRKSRLNFPYILCVLVIYSILFFKLYLNNQSLGSLARDAQFIHRFSCLIIIPYILQDKADVIRSIFKMVKTITMFLCLFACAQLLLSFKDITLNSYAVFRTIGGIPQATSLFSEPALFSQFLCVVLFIFFKNKDTIKSQYVFFGLVILGILITQSVAGFLGIAAWLIYFMLKDSKSIAFKAIIGTAVLSIIATFLLVLPDSRIAMLIDQYAINNSVDSSAERRVTTEYDVLKHFLLDEPLSVVLVGMDALESRLYRYSSLSIEDGVGGSGILEVTLRYGLIFWTLLVILFLTFSFRLKNLIAAMYFFALIQQMDGAVAKPYFWFYCTLFMIGIHLSAITDRKPRNPLLEQQYEH